jgi:hypothetical protein
MASRSWGDPEILMPPPVEEMIGDHVVETMTVVMPGDGKIEIVQDEKTGKVETGIPEGVRNP